MSVWSKTTEGGLHLAVYRDRALPRDCRFRILVRTRADQRHLINTAKDRLGIRPKASSTKLFHYLHFQDFEDLVALRLVGGQITDLIEEFVCGDETPTLTNWNA